MRSYKDSRVRSAVRARLADMPTRDVLRLIRGGPRGQRLADELEAIATQNAKKVEDDERRARRRHLLRSYVPWVAAAFLVTLILATQLQPVKHWAADQGLAWWTAEADHQLLISKVSTSQLILERGQDSTRLLQWDPPAMIILNGDTISLGDTDGWVGLDVGHINDVDLTIAGETWRYRWTNTGWQRILD